MKGVACSILARFLVGFRSLEIRPTYVMGFYIPQLHKGQKSCTYEAWMKSLFTQKLFPPFGLALSKGIASKATDVIMVVWGVRIIFVQVWKWVVTLSPWSCVGQIGGCLCFRFVWRPKFQTSRGPFWEWFILPSHYLDWDIIYTCHNLVLCSGILHILSTRDLLIIQIKSMILRIWEIHWMLKIGLS